MQENSETTTEFFKTYKLIVILVESGFLAKSKGSDSKVLFALLRHMNVKTRQCFPSLERLSSETGLSRKIVQSAIKRLEEGGIIRKHRFHAGKKFKCVYSILEAPQVNLPNKGSKCPSRRDEPNKGSKCPSRPTNGGDKGRKCPLPNKGSFVPNSTRAESALITDLELMGTSKERAITPPVPSRGSGPSETSGPCEEKKPSHESNNQSDLDDWPDPLDQMDEAWRKRYQGQEPPRRMS